jgi:hypothetical protein
MLMHKKYIETLEICWDIRNILRHKKYVETQEIYSDIRNILRHKKYLIIPALIFSQTTLHDVRKENINYIYTKYTHTDNWMCG